jgi:hypothetical protein
MIIITPNTRLVVLWAAAVPMILMINNANQNTVSIKVRILFTFVLAHLLKRLTWAVVN